MLYLGADHGGYDLKKQLKKYLAEEGIEFEDLGNLELDNEDDYPDFAQAVAEKVSKNPNDNKGILLCRTGVGMTIAADKFKGVKAALGFNIKQIKKARGDEDINVLTIASDYTSFDKLKDSVKAFLETPFSNGGRHQRRIGQIMEIEQENFKP